LARSRWFLAGDQLLLGQARAGQPVRVFGEMVSLLWDTGLIDAAIKVEAVE
jgi:hypothetical protein